MLSRGARDVNADTAAWRSEARYRWAAARLRRGRAEVAAGRGGAVRGERAYAPLAASIATSTTTDDFSFLPCLAKMEADTTSLAAGRGSGGSGRATVEANL